jgi:hypothetical protein
VVQAHDDRGRNQFKSENIGDLQLTAHNIELFSNCSSHIKEEIILSQWEILSFLTAIYN